MSERIEGYFEDFSVGLSFVTEGRTITESDITGFAGVSGDFNPIHTNAVYASRTMFGQRIAHGMLGLSVATGLATGLGWMGDRVEAFMGLEWKFRAPILIGDTIRVEIKVTNTRAMARLGGGIVIFAVEVKKQDDTVVQKGDWQLLFKSRPKTE